jgi:hypothetical protein
MIISHNLKIIFIHVHRTGGTAFSNILKQKLVDNFDVLSQHSNTKTLEPEFFKKYNDYYIFGFTRNPWERILSWYSLIHFNDQKDLIGERIRFENFIESDSASNFTTQSFHYNALDYFTNYKDELMVDKIFHYENIDKDIKSLFHQFNLDLTEFPVVNATKVKSYRDFYTDKSVNLIEQKCKKDIQYFNYSF